MNRRSVLVSLCIAGAVALAGSYALAQQAKEAKPAAPGKPEMKLPAGWTEADMQACTAAGTPGKMHAHLAADVGTWLGKNTMWMGPDSEPVKTACTATVADVMDGRFVKCEVSGEMPEMGPFKGFGLYGYDNVTAQFVGVWIDNCGTGIMNGVGELSADGKVMTWKYTYTCPITKKPTTMREVDTVTGPNSKTQEMFAVDPKSGKEYRMLLIEYTRKS
jgi:hypothetical protein